MKKLFFFICVTTLLISCTKSEDDETKINDEATFIISEPKLLITKESPYGKITKQEDNETKLLPNKNNLQVGQILKFDIKISNFDNDPNVIYVLKPITADATKHQKNNYDYSFDERIQAYNYSFLSKQDSIVFTQEKIKNSLESNPTTTFYLNILKPGTFQLQLELQKMRKNKYVAKSIRTLSFSAVKIEVYTWNEQTDNSTMFSNSKHSRYYEFTVDDGDQSNDTYLTNSDTKENTYVALYDGKKYSGVIKINEKMTFSEKVKTEKGAQLVPIWILPELKITQKRNNEPDNIITYSNLNLIQK